MALFSLLLLLYLHEHLCCLVEIAEAVPPWGLCGAPAAALFKPLLFALLAALCPRPNWNVPPIYSLAS